MFHTLRITLILFLLCTTSVIAKDNTKYNFQINIGTTVSIPYHRVVNIWPTLDETFRTAYRAGFGYFTDVLFLYNISEKFSVNTGLSCIMNNVLINDKLGILKSEGSIKTTYLQMPVMYEYKIMQSVSVSLGSYVAYLLSAKEKGTKLVDVDKLIFADNDNPMLKELIAEQDYNNSIKANYFNFDFGLSAQVAYNYQLNNKLEAKLFTKFNYGLINTLINEIPTNSSAKDWQNINVMMGLGIAF